MTSTKPCGCGGSASAHSSSGCGCGSKGSSGCGCESCQSQSFSRPQFFAGQLLTEDDLQSLGDYVVGKNRLHNRYLFGDGVVCGLTVTCPPCGSGQVTVNPGYALDCCGNDIVVSCPKDLDINQMVHQLMTTLRKADCGDPCAGTTTTGTTAPKPAMPAHRYCLYIDYCEQPSDPVAPYSSSSACGQAVCEPTRIQETFKFELRCPAPDEQRSQVGDRFWNCVGDRKAAERTVRDAEFLRRYLASLKQAMISVRENPAPPLDAYFWSQLTERSGTLKASATRIAKLKPKDLDRENFVPVIDQVLAVAGDLARIWTHPDPKIDEANSTAIAAAEDPLRRACDFFPAAVADAEFPSALARLRANALLDLSRELLAESAQMRDALATGAAPDSPMRHRFDFRLLAAGVVFSRKMAGGVADALAQIQGWVAGRLEQQTGGTNCTLLCTVNGLTLPTTESSPVTANVAVTAGEILVPAVQEVLRSCFCNALIPPCAPCDDPGVLLACLTVKDCKVVDICNLDRKFVITAPNLRYWFPEIGKMGEVLEAWCCPSCKKDSDDTRDAEIAEPQTPEESISAALGRGPAHTRLAMAAVLEPSGARRGPLEFLAPMMSSWRSAEEANIRSVLQPDTRSDDLSKDLRSALAEIKSLKREQGKLRDRIAKIEKKPAETQP